MKITIPAIPPSDNKYKGRENAWEYRNDKKYWLEMVSIYAKIARPRKPYEKATVTITYFFPDKRRRDPDNYSGKFILDGIVGNVIKDDSFDCIDLRLAGSYDKNNPRTEVEITEV